MFTKLSTPQQLQIGLVLAMAFLLVLGSNRLDQKHFSTIQTTVNSVHDDRVVVQDFIYQLSHIFHKKEIRFILKEDVNAIASENEKVEQLLKDFEATELTVNEARLLGELKNQFFALTARETKILNETDELARNAPIAVVDTFKNISQSLDGLAQIQLNESGKLTQLSNKSLGMNILLSNLETGFLVVIGIAMLALIFYPTKALKTVEQ